MKEIKIKTIVVNSEKETTTLETIAKYDKNNGTITYHEEDLEVILTIKKNKILLSRKNEDYDLNLEFKKDSKIECKHKILSIGLILELDVTTLKIDINKNNIYIKYKIENHGTDMGTFEYKLIFL